MTAMRATFLLRALVTAACLSFMLAGIFAPPAISNDAGTTLERLIDAALSAELAGQPRQRRELLHDALQAFPDAAAVRWQLGYLRDQDGAWTRPDDITAAARSDDQILEYRRLRENTTDTLAEHVELARWCRRHGLKQLESVHWRTVLAAQPGHPEAISRLRLQQIGGVWLTPPELEAWKAQRRTYHRKLEKWRPVARGWLRDLGSGDPQRRSDAQTSLAAIDDPYVIPILLELLHVSGDWHGQKSFYVREFGTGAAEEVARHVTFSFIEALAAIPEHAATLALVDQAVFSPWPDTRTAAATHLTGRTWTDFVPILVGNLLAVESERIEQIRPSGLAIWGSNVFVETSDARYSLSFQHTRFGTPQVPLLSPMRRVKNPTTGRERLVRFVSRHLSRST